MATGEFIEFREKKSIIEYLHSLNYNFQDNPYVNKDAVLQSTSHYPTLAR
jgi:hypothetical protein